MIFNCNMKKFYNPFNTNGNLSYLIFVYNNFFVIKWKLWVPDIWIDLKNGNGNQG